MRYIGSGGGNPFVGRKRHIVVGALEMLPSAAVHVTDNQDRDGAKLVLAKRVGTFPRLTKPWPLRTVMWPQTSQKGASPINSEISTALDSGPSNDRQPDVRSRSRRHAAATTEQCLG